MSVEFDALQAKMKLLDENLWERRVPWPNVENWLRQFERNSTTHGDEQLQMLFLASNFMYFGMREIRALLKSLYRDTFQHDVLSEIRRSNNNTMDLGLIESKFNEYLKRTRFLGMGNPSESGSHLL